MSRTTPPRPVDVTALFPELREHAGTSTRLHPRPGSPTVADSSVGGPLLWPADEPWPVCEDGDTHYVYQVVDPRTGQRVPESAAGRPIPYVPVAQLYRRDIPDFDGPEDTDLLQVLWCPLDHSELGYNPKPLLFWRRSADITTPPAPPPVPPAVSASYLPVPCVVHPEQVREYQYGGLLPPELDEQILAWEETLGECPDDPPFSYQTDLSLAPGWKVGGFANWSLTDPHPVDCADCGTPMRLVLTAASYERDGSWNPVEEPGDADPCPTGVQIGRGYSFYIFLCPTSFTHPPGTAMQ